MTPTIRSGEHQQRRAAHRDHEQIQLLRTIARTEAAIKDGLQAIRVNGAQDRVLEDMDIAWSSPLSPQEKLFITSTESWARYLNACLKSCRGELERRTNEQIRDNRRVMDRRGRKAFEDEPKGPSKFAGRRAKHRTQDTLRWRVPVGLQWVEWHDGTWDDTWKERLTLLQQTCPAIKAHHIVGDACVGRLQVHAHEEAEMQDLITAAGEKREDRTALRNKTALARKIGELAAK
jgi:hypothetical protein